MKDITRIHIAKVPYNIELSAKKELEKYINALELYAADSELLEDIEIRMTELLLERGVKQEAVISEADVTAIREQLGEPKEFMTEDTVEDVDASIVSEGASRKLYRNLDSAVLGGVLSGVASYFRVNSLWVRLAFIVLIFISFGLFALLYIALWVIVPPARTAAEKLQMAGRPVTLTSIRELNELGTGVDTERRAAIIKRVGTIFVGLTAIGGALVSIGAIVAVWIDLFMHRDPSGFAPEPYYLSFALAFAAGLLLTILFLLVAFAAFSQKFNKRIWISGVIIIVLGLASFGGAVISAAYQSRLDYEEVQRNTVETSIKLPDDFKTVKSLSVDAAAGSYITYIADDTTTSLKQKGLKDAPKVTVTVENGVAKLKVDRPKEAKLYSGPQITVYGPRLDTLTVTNGQVSYEAGSQEKLKAEANNQSIIRIASTRIDELTVRTNDSAQFAADEAAVATVTASIYGQSMVNLGNIKSLNVTNPDVCASNSVAQLTVQNIVSASYKHNGQDTALVDKDGPCLNVQFGTNDYGPYRYEN